MRFRPLRIDYHARAQDVAAAIRDVRTRRAALRALPNPSPRRENRQRNAALCDEGGASSLGGDDVEAEGREGKENREGGGAVGNDGGDGGEVCELNEGGDRFAGAARDDGTEGSAEPAAAAGNGDDAETPTQRIQTILNLLGPAVHPSECAFRPIAPVTEGPVRGRTLPVAAPSAPLLGEMLHSNVDYEGRRRRAAVGALECGRSRFDSGGDAHPLLWGNSDWVEGRDGARETTFVDAMHIVYARRRREEPSFATDGDDADKEHALTSRIWAQHVAALPMPESRFFTHEPDDLDRIYHLKHLRSSGATSFAGEVAKSFRPQPSEHRQRSRSGKGLALVGSTAGSAGSISSRPKMDLIRGISAPRKKEQDYAMRLNTVPFTQFLDDRHDMETVDDDETHDECLVKTNEATRVASASTKKESPQMLRPLDLGDSAMLTIRVDPDFDPLCQTASTTTKKRTPILELLKPLDELCSARSISACLHLPGRFDERHELSEGLSRFLLPQKKHQFEFLRNALKGFEESGDEEQTSELLFAVLTSRSTTKDAPPMPQKISLETDLDPPSLLPEDADGQPIALTTSKEIGSLILELPSFSTMVPFPGPRKMDGAGGHSGSMRRRFVDSSSRVSRVDSLKHVVSSSKAACLFLPQNEVQGRSADSYAERKLRQSVQRESASRALVSAVRACVPSENLPEDLIALLRGQCPAYPAAPWFESENATSKYSGRAQLDSEAIMDKRRTFCRNARARSSVEASRCVLLTGCSSRRNAEHKYSYRGFLTNEKTSPNVFKLRYNSMVEMKKVSNRTDSTRTRADDESFAGMALDAFAESFTRRKGTASKNPSKGSARGAPFNRQLKTQRHGIVKLPASKAAEAAGPPPKLELDFLAGTKIDELVSSHCSAEEDTEVTGGLGASGSVVEALERNSLKIRGELIHLVTKARELEEEKQSYLAELAVVNRGRVNTPKHVPFEGLGDSLSQARVVDLTVPDEGKSNGKRKASSELLAAELALDQRKEKKRKKKRKKDKKKKDKKSKRKKHHKRKHEDSVQPSMENGGVSALSLPSSKPPSSSKRCKTTESAESDASLPAASSSNLRPAPVIKPSLPVGMTPIVPPRKERNASPLIRDESVNEVDTMVAGSGEEAPTFDCFDASDLMLKGNAAKTSPGASRDKSPESVADLDLAPKPSRRHPERGGGQLLGHSYQATQRKENLSPNSDKSCHASAHGSGSNDADGSRGNDPINNGPQSQEAQTWNESSSIDGSDYHHGTESAFLGNVVGEPVKTAGNCPPLTLLTSESFLESFGECVAELASGRWQKALSEDEIEIANDMPKGVVVCDTALLDMTGADIELTDGSAIIVQNLSSWSEGNPGSTQKGAKAFLRRLVALAASGRYHAIHVILCLDVDIYSDLPGEIAVLQNAFIQQSGCPSEVSFDFVARRGLAASIALRSASVSTPLESAKASEFISSDENIQERARFLIMLLPSMSLHMALRCLGLGSQSEPTGGMGSGEALQNLFAMARNTSRDLFPYKTESVLSPLVAKQLWMALNTDSSHAH